MIRRPPRSTLDRSSAASDVYKRQRQAGVLAAAGLVALETMRDRLGEDHENARNLAAGLAGVDGLSLDTPVMLTNIVYVKVAGRRWRNREIVAELQRRGVLCNPVADDRLRLVTHFGIGPEEIAKALDAMHLSATATA